MEGSTNLPAFKIVEPGNHEGTVYSILTAAEVE
jgi:hypothetical protein